jgi:hypothetical protein
VKKLLDGRRGFWLLTGDREMSQHASAAAQKNVGFFLRRAEEG